VSGHDVNRFETLRGERLGEHVAQHRLGEERALLGRKPRREALLRIGEPFRRYQSRDFHSRARSSRASFRLSSRSFIWIALSTVWTPSASMRVRQLRSSGASTSTSRKSA